MLFRFFRFLSAVSSVSHCIHKICSAEMKKFGLKGSYVPYLAALEHYQKEGLTAAKLCDLCERDKAAVSRAISEMEDCGLIFREEDNGRMYRIRLFLTEKGKKTASYVKKKVTCAVEEAVKGISEDKRECFVEAFQIITQNLLFLSEKGLPQE